MAGKVLSALALAAQLAKTKKGRAYVMEKVKEKYTDFTDSQAGKIVDKAFQSLKYNKEGKPFGQFYKDMAKYQNAFKESAKSGVKTGAKIAGPAGILVGGAAVSYKDDIDKLITAISDTTSGTASAKSTSSGGSYGDDRSNKPIKGAYLDDSAPKKTFKAAFADARAEGKKTFMFEGKRYTTDVAEGKKKEAPKPKAKPPAKKKGDRVLSSTDASTARSFNRGGYANCGASMKPNGKSRT